MAVDVRQIIQELVVPELKEVRGAAERIQVEIRRLDEKTDSLRNEFNARFDALVTKIDAVDARLTWTLDIRERLAALEARAGKR